MTNGKWRTEGFLVMNAQLSKFTIFDVDKVRQGNFGRYNSVVVLQNGTSQYIVLPYSDVKGVDKGGLAPPSF